MKLVISGSRTIDDGRELDRAIKESGYRPYVSEIVHGGARGVDSLATLWALDRCPVRVFRAQWDAHGKIAGKLRNRQMADYGDALVAVWDGMSPGTAHMIATMVALDKPVHVHVVAQEGGAE